MSNEAPKTTPAVDRWKKLGQPQRVTLPSGTEVSIQVPDLPELLRAGEVPNELIKVATDASEEQAVSGYDPEKVKDATDFMRFLVSVTVKDPAITPDDVPSLPVLDRDMVIEFALRQRDTDALGHQLYGLEKLEDWKRFRRRGAGD